MEFPLRQIVGSDQSWTHKTRRGRGSFNSGRRNEILSNLSSHERRERVTILTIFNILGWRWRWSSTNLNPFKAICQSIKKQRDGSVEHA